ncbi:MAG TPA: hypothetical protein VKB12_03765 [Pyrinomonadaceae bacterium]|nr:hypothetical protein [Pyrinomonadaceae bacterium]
MSPITILAALFAASYLYVYLKSADRIYTACDADDAAKRAR